MIFKKQILGMGLLMSLISLVSAYPQDGYGMWGMMSGGYGTGGFLFGWLFSVLVLVALVLLIVWLIKQIQKK
jgi:hypothetical protein